MFALKPPRHTSTLHLLTKSEDYAFGRPALHQAKLRQMEIKAGMPSKTRRQHTGSSKGLQHQVPSVPSSRRPREPTLDLSPAGASGRKRSPPAAKLGARAPQNEERQ